jgi:hypothetical protein
MPWIKEDRLYLVLILFLVFIMAIRAPIDSDMWWHLRAGDETLTSGQVYRTDTFSSTRHGESWINHSWMSQVLMASLFRIGNYYALSIWVAICAVISMVMVYFQMEGHPLLRGMVILLAAVVSGVVWSPRPQIMSLVFLSILTLFTFKYRKSRKWIFLILIPPIIALWGNLHGGYVLGMAYLGAFLSGEILDKVLLRSRTDCLTWSEIGIIFAITALGFLFVLLNPFGIQIWQIPFQTVGVETLQNLINEWASPDFHELFQQPLLWMLLSLILTLSINERSIKGYRIIPIILFAWAAFVARRNYGPFAIVCAPVLSDELSAILEDWKEKGISTIPVFQKMLQSAGENKESFNITARNIINLVLIGLLGTTAIIKTIQVNSPDFISDSVRDFYPAGAVEWIADQKEPIRIFNDYNWGGYLIYYLPDYPVFVDGRTDLFGDDVLDDYLSIVKVDENWEDVLLEYDLDTLLIPVDTLLSRTAIQAGWSELYKDKVAVILTSK